MPHSIRQKTLPYPEDGSSMFIRNIYSTTGSHIAEDNNLMEVICATRPGMSRERVVGSDWAAGQTTPES